MAILIFCLAYLKLTGTFNFRPSASIPPSDAGHECLSPDRLRVDTARNVAHPSHFGGTCCDQIPILQKRALHRGFKIPCVSSCQSTSHCQFYMHTSPEYARPEPLLLQLPAPTILFRHADRQCSIWHFTQLATDSE